MRINQDVWDPLLALAPEEIGEFMWMFEDELADGTRLQAYKHQWSRRYLFLDYEGRAFDEVGARRFEEVEPRLLLEEAMGVGS
jgi:hypothetical protein